MQENQEPVTQSISNPVNQKSNNFLVILLSILLFTSVVIAGFFAYQTQKLVNELRVTRDELKQTPTPTPDPTANWKTYTNTKYNFSFKYPNDWIETTEPIMPNAQYVSIVSFNIKDTNFQFMVAVFPDIKDINDWVSSIKNSGLIYAKISDAKTINENIFYDVYGLGSDLKSKDYFVKIDTGGFAKFTMEPYSDLNQNMIFDQILSTFKFTN